MQIGIVGLAQSGKTTVFGALTGASAATDAAGRKEASRAVVKVPDTRLSRLSEMFKPKKTTPATVEYLDLGGMGRGNVHAHAVDSQFLALLRSVDAILVVVRAFHDDTVAHPLHAVDAARDADHLNGELVLADLIVIENRLERIDKEPRKAHGDGSSHERDLLLELKALLEAGLSIRARPLDEADDMLIRGYRFLTQKPQLIVANVSESDLSDTHDLLAAFYAYRDLPDTVCLALSGKTEAEILELDTEEAMPFMVDLGIEEAALDRLIRESYDLLGLMSFFTVGEDECRAWTIRRGTTVRNAAGVIHSDLERGFIRAEVTSFADLAALGSLGAAKAAGRQRLEGRDYVVQDGDIVSVRFAV